MFLHWLWRVWKWLLRLFTGQCELERLCYQRQQPHQLALRIGKIIRSFNAFASPFFRGKFKKITCRGKELIFYMAWLPW